MEGQPGVPRWSTARKREVVRRVARGEALEAVAQQAQAPVQEVERWLQLNLLASLAESYERRHYMVYTPHLEEYEDVPGEWQAVKPDLLVKRRGRWRAYFFETASTLRDAATPRRWRSCLKQAKVRVIVVTRGQAEFKLARKLAADPRVRVQLVPHRRDAREGLLPRAARALGVGLFSGATRYVTYALVGFGIIAVAAAKLGYFPEVDLMDLLGAEQETTSAGQRVASPQPPGGAGDGRPQPQPSIRWQGTGILPPGYGGEYPLEISQPPRQVQPSGTERGAPPRGVEGLRETLEKAGVPVDRALDMRRYGFSVEEIARQLRREGMNLKQAITELDRQGVNLEEILRRPLRDPGEGP
ncbi:MAG: hypothetical protein HYY96_16740 [Candidatus Tectomicrobia bacterium]|nr:hypothetical protein [Candidatus Tectomicrobia bacterium]